MQTEVAVVGAGPAGMAATHAAADSGCRVTLIDAYPQLGGQYYRQMPEAFHARYPHALHRDVMPAERMLDGIANNPAVEVLHNTTVWSAETGPLTPPTLYLNGEGQQTRVTAAVVILATGSSERVLPFPGWDTPGVITVGCAQTLVKSQRIRPGKRVLLAGSGPFLLAVGAQLAMSGVQVVGVYEAVTPWRRMHRTFPVWLHGSKVVEGLGYLAALRRNGVPFRYGRAVMSVTGEGSVSGVTTTRLTPDWLPVAGSKEHLEVDTLCTGYGFSPSIDLSVLLGCAHEYDSRLGGLIVRHDDSMQTDRQEVYVAGEITGIGGADRARAQGTVAGLSAATSSGKRLSTDARRQLDEAQHRVRRAARFAQVLGDVFAIQPGWLSWLIPETIVCRCEEVSYDEVAGAVRDFKARDLRTVKSLTRCGMGLCQGRICGYPASQIVRAITGRGEEQIGRFDRGFLTTPTPLAAIAGAEVVRDPGR